MKIKDILYCGIIVLLIVIYFFKPINKGKISKLEEDNISLQKRIKNQEDTIKLISAQQIPLEKSIDSLKQVHKSNQIKYVTNTKEFKIRDSIINTYSVTELERFFTDRYKQGQ